MDPNTLTPAVDAVVDSFLRAFNTLDFDGFKACLAERVSLFAPVVAQQSLIEGKSAVEAHFRLVFEHEAPAGPDIRPRNVHRLQLAEDAAVVTFEFPRGDGSSGRRSLVLQRLESAWKIVHIHASNGDPPRAATA